MAVKTGVLAAEDQTSQDQSATAPVIPSPQTAGATVSQPQGPGAGLLKQEQHDQTSQAQSAPAKKQLPTNIPSYQAQWEPQRPEFDQQAYDARKDTVQTAAQQALGVSPSAGVSHDLIRSGLPAPAVSDVFGDMFAQAVQSAKKSAADVTAGVERDFTPAELQKIKDTPVFDVPNAPFRGVIYDGEKLLVNAKEPAPKNEVLDQLKKITTNPLNALNFLNQVRQTNPAAVAGQMAQIARGDIVAAALNVQKEVGGFIGGAKEKAAQALQLDAKAIGIAHDISVQAGLGLIKAQAQIGLIHGDANNPLGVGIGPDGNPNTLLGGVSQKVGEAVSGQHIGAGTSLTDQAFQQMQARTKGTDLKGLQSQVDATIAKIKAGQQIPPDELRRAQDAAQQLTIAARSADVTDPRFLDQAKQLSGWERVKAGGEAAFQFASVANPQGLVMVEAQQITQSALEENGVNPIVAHVAGDVAGILSMGKGTVSINGLSKAGVVQRVGMGVGALGMSAVTFEQTKSEDPIERTADVIAAAVMGSTGLGHLGRQIDQFRANGAAMKVIQQTLTAEGQSKSAAETLSRQAEQAAKIRTLQTTADASLQKYNDLQVSNTGATKESTLASDKRLQALSKPVEDAHAALADAKRQGLSKQVQLIAQHKLDVAQAALDKERGGTPEELRARLGAPDRSAVTEQLGGTTEGRAAEEAAANAAQQKTLDIVTGETPPPTTEILPDTRKLTQARTAWSYAQAAVDKETRNLQKQVEGDLNTPHRQAWDSVNTHVAGVSAVMRNRVPDGIIDTAANYHQTLRVLAQRVQNELGKILKTDKEKWVAYNEGLLNPATVDSIIWPEVRQAVIDARAGYADFAHQLPENMKGEVLENFKPDTREAQTTMKRILQPNDPLSTSSPHQLPKVGGSNIETNPAMDAREYIESMGRAQINRGIRMALVDAQRPDGTRAFHPEDSLGTERKVPEDGHSYVWSGAPGLNGLIDAKIGAKLVELAKPTGEDVSLGADFGYRAFTQLYKKLAMISPVHPWNQFSASLGTDIDTLGLLKKGSKINGDASLQQEWGQYSHVNTDGEGFVYDLTDRIVSKNPILANMLDHMRSVEHQTLGRYDHVVWTTYIRNLQAGIWQTLVEKAIAEGHDPETAKIAAGHMADEITGLTNPKTYSGVEKFLQRYILFAYSWNRKHITIPAEALGFTKKLNPQLSADQADLVTHMARQYIARQQVNSWMMHMTTNMLLSGHPPWENEKGRERDIEWTGLHDMIFGADGIRRYSQSPSLNFFNFYYSKLGPAATLASGGNLTDSAIQDLSNISSPIPSFLLTVGLNSQYNNLGETLGTAFQEANPFQRNWLGPLAAFQAKHKGETMTPLQTVEGILSAVPVGITGLHEYEGPAIPFVQREKTLQQARGVGLELARMGINPYDATPEQRAAALQKFNADTRFGINPGELGAMIGGARKGTNTEYTALNKWLNDSITGAVTEQLVQNGMDATAAGEEVKATADPFSLLNSSQKRKLFQDHPEIENALDAPSTDPDPQVAATHDALARYNHGLNKLLSANNEKQKVYDADYAAGKLTLQQWIKHTQDLRTADSLAFQDSQAQLTPAELAKVNKPPSDVTPMLPAETAYWNFRQISYSDPKFQDENGVVDVKAWRQAQQDFMLKLPQDQQAYIKDREIQSQTPEVAKYLQASAAYTDQRNANQQWENLRTVYDSLTPFEKKIYRAANPQLDQYLTFRENWFTTDPQGQIAAEFFHPTDQKLWDQWTTSKQAAAVAEWYVDKYGSTKQQTYLTPWQKQVMSDKNAFATLTAKWSENDFAQLQGMIDAYYQAEATYKANESAYIKNLLNKIFHRSTAPLSP